MKNRKIIVEYSREVVYDEFRRMFGLAKEEA